MKISVCVGSSCHLKGSYDVIENLKVLIKKYNLEDEISLSASFCLGHCASGVTAKVDEHFLEGLTRDNVEEIFVEKILPRLEKN